jgi:hypothetical protein
MAARVLDGTANSEGPGLLVRGLEYQPQHRADFDSQVIEALLRLAQLANAVGEHLRDCPDPAVRRSAAVLSARAHPLLVAFDA